MKCPNCQQWTCPTPVSCLRVQLAAANERAGLAEIDARQERELREACEKALAEANECADREAEARDEDMRAAHGRFEALSAALATERAARERAEQAQASLAEKLDRVNEALASALPEGVAVESVADGAWALKAREGKAIRERDEAVKRADAMAGAVRNLLAAAPEAYGADDSILIGLVDLGEVLDLIAPKCEPRWPVTVRELRQRVNAALDAARGRG